MTTKTKLKNVLKELMETKSIDQISVTMICKKCGCHRQTFYYHFRDIYDLIAEIFVSEKIEDLDNAKTIEEALKAYVSYAEKNFAFLRATYSSSARDLPDDFINGKLRPKFLEILSANRKQYDLKKIGECRLVARRFARTVSDEIGDDFRETSMALDKFSRMMDIYIEKSTTIMLPAIIAISKETV